jgi:hypothetical protein
MNAIIRSRCLQFHSPQLSTSLRLRFMRLRFMRLRFMRLRFTRLKFMGLRLLRLRLSRLKLRLLKRLQLRLRRLNLRLKLLKLRRLNLRLKLRLLRRRLPRRRLRLCSAGFPLVLHSNSSIACPALPACLFCSHAYASLFSVHAMEFSCACTHSYTHSESLNESLISDYRSVEHVCGLDVFTPCQSEE